MTQQLTVFPFTLAQIAKYFLLPFLWHLHFTRIFYISIIFFRLPAYTDFDARSQNDNISKLKQALIDK